MRERLTLLSSLLFVIIIAVVVVVVVAFSLMHEKWENNQEFRDNVFQAKELVNVVVVLVVVAVVDDIS